MNLKTVLLSLGLAATATNNLLSVPVSYCLLQKKGEKPLLLLGDSHREHSELEQTDDAKNDRECLTLFYDLIKRNIKHDGLHIVLEKVPADDTQGVVYFIDSLSTLSVLQNNKTSHAITFTRGDVRNHRFSATLAYLLEYVNNPSSSREVLQKMLAAKQYNYPSLTFDELFTQALATIEMLQKKLSQSSLSAQLKKEFEETLTGMHEFYSLWKKAEPKQVSLSSMDEHKTLFSKVCCAIKQSSSAHEAACLQLQQTYQAYTYEATLEFFQAYVYQNLIHILANIGFTLECLKSIHSKPTICVVGQAHIIAMKNDYLTKHGYQVIKQSKDFDRSNEKTRSITSQQLKELITIMLGQQQEQKESKEHKDSKDAKQESKEATSSATTTGTTTSSASQAQQQTQACAQCNKSEAPKQCSRCKVAKYCSGDCQKAHWAQHKQQCQVKTTVH